tara:strand:- start:499 stop:1041 length:543 start_codon:yes stop_codon:yes gene_type:complete
MNKEDLDNILKAELLLKEERFSDTVKDMLKALAPNMQGGARGDLEDGREAAIREYEDSVISAGFTNYIKNKKDTRYTSFIIEFKENATGQKGVVSEEEEKRKGWKINYGKAKKSLKYTMTTREIAVLSDRPERQAGEFAKKVLEIISKEWVQLGYTVDVEENGNRLVMSHANAQDANPIP